MSTGEEFVRFKGILSFKLLNRGCVPLKSEPKSKLIKLFEFNSETVLPLENIDDKMETDNDVPDISFGLNESIFNGVIRDPFDFRDDFFNGSVNNLTIEMRVRLAHCIGLDVLPILPIRERSCILSNYYTSFRHSWEYSSVTVSQYMVQDLMVIVYTVLYLMPFLVLRTTFRL